MSYRFVIARGASHRSLVVRDGPPFSCPFCFHGTIHKPGTGLSIIGEPCDRCRAKITNVEEYNECEGCD